VGTLLPGIRRRAPGSGAGGRARKLLISNQPILRGRPRFFPTGAIVPAVPPTARSADNAESIADFRSSRLAMMSRRPPAEATGFGVPSVIFRPLFRALDHAECSFGCALRM